MIGVGLAARGRLQNARVIESFWIFENSGGWTALYRGNCCNWFVVV